MLMRNPVYKPSATDNERELSDGGPLVEHSPREMLLGQIVLLLLLVLAVLLRSMH